MSSARPQGQRSDAPQQRIDNSGGAGDESSSPAPLRCCCGRDDCVFLKHNCLVLDNVEKDVYAAAKMGQVSLVTFLCPFDDSHSRDSLGRVAPSMKDP